MQSKIARALVSNQEFSSIKHKTLMGLMLVHNQAIEKNQAFFKSYGITQQQYNVLRILRGQFPQCMPMQIIRERMIDKMSDVTRLAERLEKNDLILRNVNPRDKRIIDVKITEKGLDMLKEIDQYIHILWRLNDISDEEAQTFCDILEKILE